MNASFSNEQLRVLALCAKLARKNDAPETTAVGRAQRHFRNGKTREAIRVLAEFLAHNGVDIDTNGYEVDGPRLRSHRDIAGLTQAELAVCANVGTAQINHYERQRSGIGLCPLLLIVSHLGILAHEIVPSLRAAASARASNVTALHARDE